MDILVTKENKEQALQSVYKSIIGFIPGNHILNELLDYRANVQQNRLNKFSEFLKNSFEDVTGKSFDPEHLKSEHFIDVFETIVRKVASTGNEEKLKRYRNVLLRTMFEKNDSEIFFKYVDMIDSVSETQVLILSAMSSQKTFSNDAVIMYLNSPTKFLKEELFTPEIDEAGIFMFNGQKLLFSELALFLDDLERKGLMYVNKNPASRSMITGLYKAVNYNISPIGKGFIEFIDEYGK